MANDKQMRQELGKFLLAGGWQGTVMAVPALQEKAIAEMARTIPTHEAAKYKTDIQKAYRVMQIMQQNNAGAAGAPGAGTANSGGGVDPGSDIPVSSRKALGEKFAATAAETQQVTASSMIQQILLDKPSPKDLIEEGATGLIKKSAFEALKKQIADGELSVCENDSEDIAADKRIMSKDNWKTIEEAFANGTPLPVYRGEISGRPIGYKVIKGNTQGNNDKVEILDRNEMFEFVTLETEGYIQPSEFTPGVKLKQVSKTSKSQGTQATQTTVLADLNRKNVMKTDGSDPNVKAEKAFEVTCQVLPSKSSATLKTELRVRFNKLKDDKKDDGSYKTVTKRISLEGERHDIERLGEYTKKFGSTDNYRRSQLLELPTGKAAAAIAEARLAAVYEMQRKVSAGQTSDYNREAVDRLNAIFGSGSEGGAAGAAEEAPADEV